MLKIIQWNIHGYRNTYIDLQVLAKSYNPQIIALQETHFTNLCSLPTPINYSLYTSKNNHNNFGGTALLTHNSIPQNEISVSSDFDAVGVSIQSKSKFNIISAYISTSKPFNANHLANVLDSPNAQTLLLGDFNSWHPYWGSPKSNTRVRTMANYIDRSNSLLNTQHIHTH